MGVRARNRQDDEQPDGWGWGGVRPYRRRDPCITKGTGRPREASGDLPLPAQTVFDLGLSVVVPAAERIVRYLFVHYLSTNLALCDAEFVVVEMVIESGKR